MTPSIAFCLLILLANLTIVILDSCSRKHFCPCGVTFCLDDKEIEIDPCERLANCLTCKSNGTDTLCETCPTGFAGQICAEVANVRNKRQYVENPFYNSLIQRYSNSSAIPPGLFVYFGQPLNSSFFPHGEIKNRNRRQHPENPFPNMLTDIAATLPRPFGTCPPLERPELASINCEQLGNYRSCTARCLPGYKFEDDAYDDEITLECVRGSWTPRSFFPPCKAEGHCKLQVRGYSYFNCTTDMNGTHCKVICDNRYQGIYHCYPGRRWNPPLPYCAHSVEIGDSRTPCRCENGGHCNSDGNCVCPRGTSGRNCEQVNREGVLCPDPGIPRGSTRLNTDGSPSSQIRNFEEGESLVYQCSDEDSALTGSSLLTCRSNGRWSEATPHCTIPDAGQTVCPDPGYIPNGNRLNVDGSPSHSYQVYSPGQSVVYSCRRDFALRGSSLLTCLRTGSWSGERPRCTRIRIPGVGVTSVPPVNGQTVCVHPGVDRNGEIEDHPPIDPRKRGQTFPLGTELKFLCNDGYEPEGAVILYCTRNGQWSNPPPRCKVINSITEEPSANRQTTCPHPGVDQNGEIEDHPLIDPRKRGQTFPLGTELKFLCNDGYEPEGAVDLYCLQTGQWSSSPPTCKEIYSITDPVDDDGSLIRCLNPGLISNGRLAIIPTLDERNRPHQATANDFEYSVGTRLQYSCEDAYVLQGDSDLICEPNSFWSHEVPFCVEDCGRSPVQEFRRITHGTRTVAGEWPWTVAIGVIRDNFTSLTCGGVLLNRRTVLTAAHCLLSDPMYTLYFGKFYMSDNMDDDKVRIRRSSQIIRHPEFDNATLENDIALIRFRPIRYSERMHPICLPTARSADEFLVPAKKGYVTGWGLTEKGVQAEELLMAHIPVQSNEKCMESYRNRGLPLQIRRGMFCAGFDEGVTGTCRGDSGSPLIFYNRTTQRHTVEGLVSFTIDGLECGTPKLYTVFTKVVDYMPWIIRNFPR